MSQNKHLKSLIKVENETFISIYSGELTDKCLIENIKKIKSAFPTLNANFYSILGDRLIENNFNDERLIDAVNNVIDNCIYPEPTIAQFISFDKRIKLFSYYEISEMVLKYGKSIWNNYKAVKTESKQRLYASLEDIKTYNIELI